ncbi:alpha/beta hydrolase [Paenibacillus polymyxa]|uniref:alpha/beta hydrolase n=1 Tax=Paenibacillus polymyxa TaxID=1406 RepID=UPI0023F775CB|nr:alpha/beta hydrolase [Paenibacillus polymyxa]MDN4085399.1 alpha/beta hydrolase [Paenibacillus polymyxa]MDN4090800.1 alpha/beta hydrolase [Paenibacillus polymyxa]MDN4111389.1 alpha/beta hydrolase [Paenibacillus polymyxa]
MKNERKGRKKMLWGFIYVGVFILVFAASAIIKMTYNPLSGEMQVHWNDAVGHVYSDIAYDDKEQNKFDLYVPADNTKKSYGLVVYLHAGGFSTGDKSDDANMLKWLTSKGYVAAGINYTLRNENNPEASVYTMSQEIKKSIPVVKAEAEKLGYNLDRMAISGGSAGGTLALLYAYRDADTSPIPVKMVFEMVGPPSFYPEDWVTYGLDQNPEAAANLFSVMSGNTITTDMIGKASYDEAVKDISPFMWIDKNSVPTLAAYGKYDKVAPFGTVKYLINALEENNVPHDYFEFPHSGHGLQNDNKLYLKYIEKLNEYLERYMGSE